MNRAERRRLQKQGAKNLSRAEAEQLFHDADAHLAAGNIDAAMRCYQRLHRAEPENPEILNMLGVLTGQQNDPAKACQLIRKAIRINPGQASYYSNLGLALRGANELDEAVHAFRKAIELDPQLAQAHNNLGSTLKRRGELDAAIESYRQALHIDPDYRDAQLNLAGTLLRTGELAKARELIDRALHLNPADLEMQHLLGLAFMDEGNYDDALKTCTQLLQTMVRTRTPPPTGTPAQGFDKKLARQALLDLKKVLDNAGVKFFLRSGTLLGCIREGDFLAHDKDIDIGVFESIDKTVLVELITASDCFTQPADPHAEQNTVSFSVQHRNTIGFDIYFYRDMGDHYTTDCFIPGKSYTKTFTKFSLQPVTFIDTEFMAPDNPGLYLSELYGNWKEPDHYFDSMVSSRNLDAGNEQVSLCYAISRISDALQKADNERANAYCKQALELDPGNKAITQVLAWLKTSALVSSS
ncbi:MAG: tetratricopeptide repeat protein [Gammaproteobacteria bacterium]|nr:tetratricopeptide repeat protein [Gammaproteobacteria bacterium]